ncbi:MAG: imidazole glycerol phosphate synthase, glutamine amidotransferase subunit [Bacteroidetes bacterium GWF2_40_14]|nr:MAG: imidazole glycerol phosphate synthase, glutamine amidotransferase subunit [Bacteroidetes bacterium GWF2_40_14]
MKIVIVNYGMGNIYSIQNALKFLGFASEYSDDPAKISNADKIILPGVGSYRKAMQNIISKDLKNPIKEAVEKKGNPILGICLGMQLLGISSTEDGYTKGLGLFDGIVERFDEKCNLKIPHIGYNEVMPASNSVLFQSIKENPDFYFVHSYRMMSPIENGITTCNYGENFIAAFEQNNVFGTQFHPEKSQTNGLILLKNFLSV